MNKTVRLLTTDSYYNLFDLLISELDGKTSGINGKNLIFTEEKISLMTERRICEKYLGTFNTEVYSFGNYLSRHKKFNRVLSKEGSAMAVRRVLESTPLTCFKAGMNNLSVSLYDLIILLSSAKVSPEDIKNAIPFAGGVLKNKLNDVYAVYSGYTKYLKENNLEDQSSTMNYLSDLIKSQDLTDVDVYIFGYQSFTAQIREVISAIICGAKSVTAILTRGDNEYSFVNECPKSIKDVCRDLGITVEEHNYVSPYNGSAKLIEKTMFNPVAFKREKLKNDNVYFEQAKNPFSEIEFVAKAISSLIKDGARYKDFTVVVSDIENYREDIVKTFSLYNIPYFIDEKIKPTSHPLITLITSYFDVAIKGFNIDDFLGFVKNPLILSDKNFLDAFCDYLISYNIAYDRLKTPFTLPASGEGDLEKFEEFRQKTVSLFDGFSVDKMLEKLNVKEKLEVLGEQLKSMGENEEWAVNGQIYNAVSNILSEMKLILSGVKVGLIELKNFFLTGVNALELSIIPQYNDAVFIGGFKEAGQVNSENLFVVGLTESVPNVSEDVSILTDYDIDALSSIKVLIEPKISVVNKRSREEATLGLSAFKKRLILSYPVSDTTGKKNFKSEIIRYVEKLFELNKLKNISEYVNEKQMLRKFAIDVERYCEGIIPDFTEGTTFYHLDEERAKPIIDNSGKEIKVRLNRYKETLLSTVTSPTAIEDFYKCPYRFFINHGLHVKEKESGRVDALLVGNLMHEIFKKFVDAFDEIKSEEDADAVYIKVKDEILKDKKYSKFLIDVENKTSLKDVLSECEKYCKRTYSFLTRSKFRPTKDSTEVKFGDGGKYPAISLDFGKVKLSGKIDRVDYYGDYCRILDYKTGSVDSTDKSIFAGIKLQLFLYALAVSDKKLAGAYYVKVADAFKTEDKKDVPVFDGKTLEDREILTCQDSVFSDFDKSDFIPVSIEKDKIKKAYSESDMESFKKYAKLMCESAVKELKDGVIIASPYKGECEYCKYKSICKVDGGDERELKGVSEKTIAEAVESVGDKQC